jgi:integrase
MTLESFCPGGESMAAVTANVGKYKTASGTRYRVRITNRRLIKDASKFNKAGFRTRREADAYARRMQQIIGQLELGEVEHGHTLGELITRYIQDGLPRLNRKDQRTRKNQLAWWRHHLGPDLLLAHLTPRRINEALTALAVKPRESAPRGKRQAASASSIISSATVNRYRSSLAAACAFGAKELFWLAENPVHGTRTRREPAGRVRYLSPEEIERLGVAVDAEGGHLPLLFWLGLSTGARLGELLSAEWPNVQFGPKRTATITLPTTKNGEPRVLPVTLPRATQLLRLQRMRHAKDCERVIPPSRNGKTHSDWYRKWRSALATAQIEDFRFHDLRHCFASYLAMSGQDHIQIADLTGHKSFAMVKRYAHLNPKARQANAARGIAAMGLGLGTTSEGTK